MNDDFYVAFEEKFRGSEELIKERQKKYLKFINPLKILKDEVKALDIGCGRGEWISLLNENGFNARGIDVNESMVRLASQKGLNAAVNDALGELRSLDENSIDIITAFQVVEHIKFDDVLELIKEAKRVLAPCGILILETPNPENIMVGTQWFYLDATHKNPIPCELLSFATHYYGLERNFIFKTNEKSPSEYERDMGLFDVFEGVSPDYSVIAQKNGDQSELFDEAFAVMPGVNLAQISASYNNKFDKLKQQIDGVLNAYIKRYEAAQNELNDMLNSKSWRITKPLRVSMKIAKKIVGRLKRYARKSKILMSKEMIINEQAKTLTKKELQIYNLLKKD
ncbi:methyltransferase domain protein [Campylobacter rectus RM3267]|uniref:SAM-dependent methyltransferase n=2 Tax=Campylobacter rectus TaxID=203 RepID=A0A6G5QLE9_CAMRE|nr:methyltransferase domain-containing protein [Campylobacter rectus]EEF13247.1 methyltransferase domain protein [Campylobacter rectus RM3267]QCD46535.1 SAM-dependent methyltransferase [Campylobacter rectus]UEB47236.1 class I SAM-dependent methyltransferase [Campylobacter rectus]